MESKINYTLVGLFVVFLCAGLITFAYWLGTYGGKQEADYYHIFMVESVAGLSTDSSVKYRGVDVGVVENIALNANNPEQVELLIRVEHATPVKVDTVATLKSFGLTGLVYVELEGGTKDAPLLKSKGSYIPEIKARTSAFVRISESLVLLTDKTAKALDKLDRLLSQDNLNHVDGILAHAEKITEELRTQMGPIKELIEGGVMMENRAAQAFEQVTTASTRVKEMATGLETNSAQLTSSISADVRKSLESFNQLLYELDILAGNLQSATQTIEASPGDLFFKHSTPKPGPGEKGYNEK